jgi:hypothetical protein
VGENRKRFPYGPTPLEQLQNQLWRDRLMKKEIKLAQSLLDAGISRGVVVASSEFFEIRIAFKLDKFTGEFVDIKKGTIQWLDKWFDVDLLPSVFGVWGVDLAQQWTITHGGMLTRGAQ